MREYEQRQFISRADLFQKHKTMPEPEAPCKKGDRTCAYMHLMEQSKWIGHIRRVFGSNTEMEEARDKFLPGKFDKTLIDDFKETCLSENMDSFFKEVSEFQRDSVRLWNPHADEVTESNYMGTVGIDEAASKECAALGLDLSLKGGIMKSMKSSDKSEDDDGDGELVNMMWKLTRDYEAKRLPYLTAKACSMFCPKMDLIYCDGPKNASLDGRKQGLRNLNMQREELR